MKLIKVTSARWVRDYMLELMFNDGLAGTVDLKSRLHGKIFEPLLDIDKFKNFKLNRWTIEWENGADLAPESLHEMCLKQTNALA